MKGKSQKESSIIRELFGWIAYIAIILAITFFIVTYVGQRTTVQGSSMESTLQDGDNLIVEKISYRFVEPERFDIVVFPYRYEPDTFYIKRIIGLPGETIQIKEGFVYINDTLLEEDVYGLEVMMDPGIAANPIQLGEDEYFVLGDNRNNSSDSRTEQVGVIKKDELIGRAWVRIFPFSKVGVIKHE